MSFYLKFMIAFIALPALLILVAPDDFGSVPLWSVLSVLGGVFVLSCIPLCVWLFENYQYTHKKIEKN